MWRPRRRFSCLGFLINKKRRGADLFSILFSEPFFSLNLFSVLFSLLLYFLMSVTIMSASATDDFAGNRAGTTTASALFSAAAIDVVLVLEAAGAAVWLTIIGS